MSLVIEIKVKNKSSEVTDGLSIDSSITQTLDIDITREPNPIDLISKILTDGRDVMVCKANELFTQ